MSTNELSVGCHIKHLVTRRTGVIVAQLWFNRGWKICVLNSEGYAQYYNVYPSEIVRRW